MERDNAVKFLSRFTDVDEVELLKVLRELPSVSPQGPWLAGGAIRRTLIGMNLNSDFGFFFRDAVQLAVFRKELESKGARRTAQNEHAETYILKISDKDRIIQLVKMDYYESAESLLD